MNQLISKLTNEFKQEHRNVQLIYPKYCMVQMVCQYDQDSDSDDQVEQTRSLYYSSSGPPGIFVHNEKYNKHVVYSQTYELIEKLAVPCMWAEDTTLIDGYKLKQMRLSKNLWPGDVICRGVKDDPSSHMLCMKDFHWNDLPEIVKQEIRDKVATEPWPAYYPRKLAEYFSDVKSC